MREHEWLFKWILEYDDDELFCEANAAKIKEWHEKAKKWDRFMSNPLIQLEANKQTDFLIECYDKLEAIKSLIKGNKIDRAIAPIIDEFGDGVQHIIKKLEKILQSSASKAREK